MHIVPIDIYIVRGNGRLHVREISSLTTGVLKSRFEESIKYISDLCTRIERDVIALSARGYVTQRAVENLSALTASCNKHLKPPSPPQTKKNDEIAQMDNRN